MSDEVDVGPAAAEQGIRTYQLAPDAFEPTAKRRIRRRFAWVVPFIVGLLAVELALMARAQPGTADTLPVVVPLVLAALAFGWFRAIRAQLKDGRAGWDSYRLTIGPNVLRRFIANLPPIEIIRTEVTQIVDSGSEGLHVATADRHRFIFIPKDLVGFDEVRGRLAGWKAIEAPKTGRHRALGIAGSVVLIGSWIGTGVIPDIRLAMVSALVLFAAAGMLIREVSKLKVAENKQKAATIGGLGLLLLAPFARLILHFVYHAEVRWPP